MQRWKDIGLTLRTQFKSDIVLQSTVMVSREIYTHVCIYVYMIHICIYQKLHKDIILLIREENVN